MRPATFVKRHNDLFESKYTPQAMQYKNQASLSYVIKTIG